MGAYKKINEGEVSQYYVENSHPDIYEDQIKEGFIKAFYFLIENKEEIIMGYEVILEELLDTTKLEKNELVERYKKAQDELNEIEEKQQENKVRKDSIDTFIDSLKSQDTILTDFDEALWASTIDKVVIDKDITFHFKDGTKIKQEMI